MAKIVKRADLTDSKKLLVAGTGYKDRYAMLADDLKSDIVAMSRLDEPRLPKSVDGQVNGTVFRDYKGSKTALLAQTRLGKTSVLTPRGGFVEVDLRLEVRKLYAQLIANSPILSGEYRRSFKYVVDGDVVATLPPAGELYRVGVINTADYASTLENPSWPRPFNLTWRKFFKEVKGRMDARMYYFTPEGGRYAAPIIEIGYLNSMRRTGIQPARHRRNRRKTRG